MTVLISQGGTDLSLGRLYLPSTKSADSGIYTLSIQPNGLQQAPVIGDMISNGSFRINTLVQALSPSSVRIQGKIWYLQASNSDPNEAWSLVYNKLNVNSCNILSISWLNRNISSIKWNNESAPLSGS